MKQLDIGQCITQCSRPRSIVCPVVFGLGVQLEKSFGSKWLVNHLHRLGYSISYDEVVRYKQSAINCTPSTPEIENGSFRQWVADNVDHNLVTLTGKGEPETNNIYDPEAMIIRKPLLQNILVKYHEDVTKESVNGHEQRVKNIAGKSIGRVSATVCKLFKTLLGNREVYSITCYGKDKATISTKLHSCQYFRKKPGKKGIRGGGGVIPSNFALRCSEEI